MDTNTFLSTASRIVARHDRCMMQTVQALSSVATAFDDAYPDADAHTTDQRRFRSSVDQASRTIVALVVSATDADGHDAHVCDGVDVVLSTVA